MQRPAEQSQRSGAIDELRSHLAVACDLAHRDLVATPHQDDTLCSLQPRVYADLLAVFDGLVQTAANLLSRKERSGHVERGPAKHVLHKSSGACKAGSVSGDATVGCGRVKRHASATPDARRRSPHSNAPLPTRVCRHKAVPIRCSGGNAARREAVRGIAVAALQASKDATRGGTSDALMRHIAERHWLGCTMAEFAQKRRHKRSEAAFQLGGDLAGLAAAAGAPALPLQADCGIDIRVRRVS